MPRHAPRQADEAVLRWIAARIAGRTVTQIAADEGISASSVNNMTNGVRKADITESGEPEQEVRAEYWA